MASVPTRNAVEILTLARNEVVGDIRSAVEDHMKPAREWTTAVVRLTHAIDYVRMTDYRVVVWNDLPGETPLAEDWFHLNPLPPAGK
jgi:hypothetical protein